MEKVKVGHDGFGGLVVFECSEKVAGEIMSIGLHDVVESKDINKSGVFELTLSESYETCDCSDVYGCGHRDHLIFEIESIKRLGDLIAP